MFSRLTATDSQLGKGIEKQVGDSFNNAIKEANVSTETAQLLLSYITCPININC